jgi:hypothetical protein
VPPYFDPLAHAYHRYAQITDDLYRPFLLAAVPDLAGRPGSWSGRPGRRLVPVHYSPIAS